MAGGVFSGAKLHGMTIRESATDGSDFTNPDADYRRLFLGEDGLLHVKDSAGSVSDPYDIAGGSSLFPLIGEPAFGNSGDKDFRGASDLTPYTAVGSDGAGTVVLAATTTTLNIYEFTAAGLLLQNGHAEAVGFRADYTLPDNQSMVIAMSAAPNILAAGDNMFAGLRLNDDDSLATAGNWIAVGFEQDTTEYIVQGFSSIDATGRELTSADMYPPPLILFRVSRSSLTYRSWVSMNGGATWTFVDQDTFAGALTNIWISFLGSSSGQTYIPTMRIPFICEGAGDDAYDPW